MPRRPHGSLRRSGNKQRPVGGRDEANAAPLGGRVTQQTSDGDFLVRTVPGAAARKPYRCPGCQQVIPVGTAHLVVWPVEDPSWVQSAADSRRHWHTPCWQRRAARGGARF